MTPTNESQNELSNQLIDQMMNIFNLVIVERQHHFAQKPKPNKQDIPWIIVEYAASNMAISGGLGLIPGPFGLLGVIPEIILIIRNQVAMIYDIGAAYGKDDVITVELLLGIFGSTLGVGGISLITMHGSKILVRRASLRVIQQVIGVLAGQITQRLIKATISKWLPIVGAVAVAAWSYHSTTQIGQQAVEIFNKDIQIVSEQDEQPEDG